MDSLPKINTNWLGIYPTSIPQLYSTVKIEKENIVDFKNKSKEGYKYAFIGLAGVYIALLQKAKCSEKVLVLEQQMIQIYLMQ